MKNGWVKARMKTRTGWKVLLKGNKSSHNNFKWRKGKWYKHEGELSLCESGFHASDNLVDAMKFVTPGVIAKVEYRGEVVTSDDKFVASEMRVVETYRFTKRMAVEWSVYCARSVYKNWTAYNKKDKRVLKAIQAAEKWLANPTEANKKAAWSAAWSAASSAASSATSSAAWSAASSATSSATSSAARSATSSAARSARLAAASAAESVATKAHKKKLHNKLLKIIGAKQ